MCHSSWPRRRCRGADGWKHSCAPLDIVPTLLEIAGLDAGQRDEIEGVSQVPANARLGLLVAVALVAAATLTLVGLSALLVADRPSTIPEEWRAAFARLLRRAGGKRADSLGLP